jgi:hypothetical protein
MNHVSPLGHVYVAEQIHEQMAAVNFRSTHDPTVAPWEHMDRCNQWLRMGTIDMSLVTGHKNDMVMNGFSASAKLALEVRSPDAWFKVQNTLGGRTGKPAYLTIEYMMTNPDCMYPKRVFQVDSTDQHAQNIGMRAQNIGMRQNTIIHSKLTSCIKYALVSIQQENLLFESGPPRNSIKNHTIKSGPSKSLAFP